MRERVLVTGASGGLATMISEALATHMDVTGLDVRPHTGNQPFPGEFLHVDYRSRKVSDLFQQRKFNKFIHLGRLQTSASVRNASRYNVNVLGTRALLDMCAKHAIPSVTVLSSFHVYGAHQYNPLYLSEADPLLATHGYPELSDAVELDNLSVNFSLKHPEKKVAILRPVNVVGLRIRNHMTQYLRNSVCPTLLGYDPAMQFIHETDLKTSIMLSLEKNLSGIYNIAGEGLVPLSKAIFLAGGKALPLPSALSSILLSGMGLAGYSFPRHLLDFFKYPTVISDRAFRVATGFKPKVSVKDTLTSVRTNALLLAKESFQSP